MTRARACALALVTFTSLGACAEDPSADEPAATWPDVTPDIQRPERTESGQEVVVVHTAPLCSAKLDCGIALVPDADGEPGDSVITGLACLFAEDEDDGALYLSDLVLACDDVDLALRPTSEGWALGPVPPLLYEHAVFRGIEEAFGPKYFWNVALGVELEAMRDCSLHLRAALGDSRGPYPDQPVIAWNTPLTDADGALVCAEGDLYDGVETVATEPLGAPSAPLLCHRLARGKDGEPAVTTDPRCETSARYTADS